MGHKDGREVIFDGDTRKPIRDPNLKGTFNYAVVPPINLDDIDLEQIQDFLDRSYEHAKRDILPAIKFGNRRKRGE